MYSAIIIARCVIQYSMLKGNPVSNIQLQKILYYIQLNFYRILDKPAFYEDIEAWQYGPVVPCVYNEYSLFGSRKICQFYPEVESMFSNMELDVIRRVTDMCIKISPWELVRKSHRVGGPWQRVYKGCNTTIPNELIMEYSKKGH